MASSPGDASSSGQASASHAVAAAASSSASTASVPAPPKGPGRIEERRFASKALGVEKRYEVYLPAGYEASPRRYPTIYMLHGLGGDETNWLKHGGLEETANGLGLEAVVIMPDGDAGFYVNSEAPKPIAECLAEKPHFNPGESPASFCVKTPHYEDYLTQDLITDVDAHYRTLSTKQSRGIGGLSMGGYGALMIALRHPDLFGAAASHSGWVSALYTGPHPFVSGHAQHASSPSEWGGDYKEDFRDHVRSLLGPSIDAWRQHDPVTLASKLTNDGPKLYIDCGLSDDFKFQDQASELHEVLLARKIDHEFELAPGRHLFDFWKARLPKSLAFFARVLQK